MFLKSRVEMMVVERNLAKLQMIFVLEDMPALVIENLSEQWRKMRASMGVCASLPAKTAGVSSTPFRHHLSQIHHVIVKHPISRRGDTSFADNLTSPSRHKEDILVLTTYNIYKYFLTGFSSQLLLFRLGYNPTASAISDLKPCADMRRQPIFQSRK